MGGYADSSSDFADSVGDDASWEEDRKDLLDQSESLEDNQDYDLFGDPDDDLGSDPAVDSDS